MYINPNTLKKYLDRAGMTYEDLKKAMGYSDSTLKMWCNNKKGIGYFNLYKLAKLLKCNMNDLTLNDPSEFVGPQSGEKYNNRRYRINIENLKRIRKDHGYTQTTLSKKLGVGGGCVHRWESGARGISSQNLENLAKVLNCDMSELAYINERGPLHIDKSKVINNPYIVPEIKNAAADNEMENAVGNLLSAMKDFTSYVSERLDKQQTDIEVLSKNTVLNENKTTQSINIGLNENIGKKLLAARYKKNLTVEQLSNMSGLSQGSIYKMESNRTPINLNMLEKVINVLGMRLDISSVE